MGVARAGVADICCVETARMAITLYIWPCSAPHEKPVGPHFPSSIHFAHQVASGCGGGGGAPSPGFIT